MYARLHILALSLLALVQADAGWARDWRVERVSGTAWTIETAEKRSVLTSGMTVPEGLTIATAKSGRIRLSSENNVMTLGPGSVAVVRPQGRFSSKTEVVQRVGSIEFDIEKRTLPHFSVQTPFLAAVVKGTAFTIDVSKTDATIGVSRGLVQVRDLKTGETAGVGAGQRASASATAPGLRTAGVKAPNVTPGQPSVPGVAPAGQALSSFRAAQAAEAQRASAPSADTDASTHGDAGVSSSRTSGFGGYGGGDSNGRDRPSIGSTNAQTHAGDSEPAGPGKSAGGLGSSGSAEGPRAGTDKGSTDQDGVGSGSPGNNGNGNAGSSGDGGGNSGNGSDNGGPGGNNGGGNGNGNNGNGNGNGGPSGNDGSGNGNGNNGNGNGNGGPSGSDGAGNGNGNNGNGNGNGGPSGNDGAGNGNGNNGNGNGNGGPSGNNGGGNGNGNNGNGNGNGGGRK